MQVHDPSTFLDQREGSVVSTLVPTSPDVPTVLVTLTGPDRPGVTTAVFDGARPPGVEVLDVEQVVVRGRLTLGVLVTAGHRRRRPGRAARTAAGAALGHAGHVHRRAPVTTRPGAAGACTSR